LRGHASLVAPASRPRPPQPRLQNDQCFDCLHDLITPAEWSASSSSSYSYSSSSLLLPLASFQRPGRTRRALPRRRTTTGRSPPRRLRSPPAAARPQADAPLNARRSFMPRRPPLDIGAPLAPFLSHRGTLKRCLQRSSSPWSSFSLVLCYSLWPFDVFNGHLRHGLHFR